MPSDSEMARAQHTDMANDAPLMTATNAGDDLTQLSSRSTPDIASDNELGQQRLSGAGADAVTAPVQAGK